MEAELKEKIRNLNIGQKIEFEYKNFSTVVQNYNYEVKIILKPKFILKAIALIILFFAFAIVGILLYGAGVKAGGLTVFIILFLYKPLAIVISKTINSKELKDLKEELSDIKYGEIEARTIDYSKLVNTNRNKALNFTEIKTDKTNDVVMDVKEKAPKINLENKTKTIKNIIEFIFTSLLCFVLIEVKNQVTGSYDSSADLISYAFCGIMYIILLWEMIRRKQVTEKRPQHENYLYIVFMFLVMFSWFYMLKTFYSEI